MRGINHKNFLSQHIRYSWILFWILLGFNFLNPGSIHAQLPFPVQPVRGVSGDLWADVVLGQDDFSGEAPRPDNKVVYRPFGVFVDHSNSNNQRMYVWDSGNCRILGYSDINIALTKQGGQLGVGLCLGSDANASPMGADMVIGQQDFNHTSANGDSNFQSYPGMVNWVSYLMMNPTSQTLNLQDPRFGSPGESGSWATMAVDSGGNLYAPDVFNNRVLRYAKTSLVPGAMGISASAVWGQQNFNSYGINQSAPSQLTSNPPTNSSLSLVGEGPGAGVAVDNWGNLWVADSGNNRVLRFPLITDSSSPDYNHGLPATNADIVLGQADFTSAVEASGMSDTSHFKFPTAIRVDNSGDVFVGDIPSYGRVLIFIPNQPFNPSTGPAAYRGQSPATVISGLNYSVTGLEIDPTAPSNKVGLWVNYEGNSHGAVLQYLIDFSGPVPSFTVNKSLMEACDSSGNLITTTGVYPPTAFHYQDGESILNPVGGMLNHGGIGVDQNGNVFISFADTAVDVWRYPDPRPNSGANALPTGITNAPDVCVFKTKTSSPVNNITSRSSAVGGGVAVASALSSGTTIQQFVSSEASRLMYWNLDYTHQPSLGLFNGKNADGFVGTTPSTYLYGRGGYGRIASDSLSPQPHLWVINGNGTFVEVFNLPLTPWAQAAVTFNGSSTNNTINVLGGGTLTWEGFAGISVDPAGNLWLADQGNNRVFRVRNPLTNPQVDIVLGQPNATANLANQGGAMGATTLNNCGSVVVDQLGNVFISDFGLEVAGNYRLLEFDASTVNNNTNICWFAVPASHAYERNSLTDTQCEIPAGPEGQNLGICAPFEPAISQDDSVLVVGGMYNGARYPVVLYDPLHNFTAPATFLMDFTSMGTFSSAFDSQGDLFFSDPDRSRILVYWKPFSGRGPVVTLCTCPLVNMTYGSSTTPHPVNGPGQVAVGIIHGGTDLFVDNFASQQVLEFQQGIPNAINEFSQGVGNSLAIGLSPGGNYLYACNYMGNQVVQFNLTSSTPTVASAIFAQNTVNPNAVAVADSLGITVFVGDENNVHRYVFSGGSYNEVVPALTATSGPSLNNISSILLDGNKVYAVDQNNGRIVWWTTPNSGATYNYMGVAAGGFGGTRPKWPLSRIIPSMCMWCSRREAGSSSTGRSLPGIRSSPARLEAIILESRSIRQIMFIFPPGPIVMLNN